MITIKTIPVGQMEANCYLVYDDEKHALIIDPGDDSEYLINVITELDLTPKSILATHGHFDHNMAVFELKIAFNIPYLISKEDVFLLEKMQQSAKHFLGINTGPAPAPDAFLVNGRKIEVGDGFFKVIATPGHTPGGVSFYNPLEKMVFVGDLIFKNGSTGRYDFSYSSRKNLFESIQKVMNLTPETIIYSGHGEPTSVSQEKTFYKLYKA